MKLTHVFLCLSLFVVFGCATAPRIRPASEFLLTSEKGMTQSVADVKQALTQKKYVIQQENPEIGVLISKPRSFSYNKNGVKTPARQTVQMRQEGGSVKLRLQYECQITTESGAIFQPCHLDDAEATAKILRLDHITAELVREALQKKDKTGEDGESSGQSWGTEIK